MSDFIGRRMPGKMPGNMIEKERMPAAPESIGGFDRQPGQTNWPGGQAPTPAAPPSYAAPLSLGGQLGAARQPMLANQGAAQQSLGANMASRAVAPGTMLGSPAPGPAMPGNGPAGMSAQLTNIPLGYGR